VKEYVILRDKGGNCRGDRVMLNDADAATYISHGVAASLDQSPLPIQSPQESPQLQQQSTQTEQAAHSASHVKTGVELWEFDRWPKPVAEGLVAGGIHTVEQLQAFVASGKKLEDLKGIGKKTESDLIEMYCSE
jgi:hypothetical protein